MSLEIGNYGVADEQNFILADEAYECLLEMNKAIFENQCFIVLNKDITLYVFDYYHVESYDLWESIYPIVWIKGDVISNEVLRSLK